MDSSDYPSLPQLARMHTRLAADSRRVGQIVDRQMDVVERLFQASISEDWVGVARASLQLAKSPEEKVGADVIAKSRKVYQELTSFAGGFKRPRHLSNLLVACRELRIRSG